MCPGTWIGDEAGEEEAPEVVEGTPPEPWPDGGNEQVDHLRYLAA